MSTATKELVLPDADWDAFVAEMERADADEEDGLGGVESRIDWYLETIREGVAEMARNGEVATRRHNMIQDWEMGEAAKIERRNTYLIGQIGMLAPSDEFKMKAIHGKKSRSLPNGTFGYRTGPDRVEIGDAEAALLYAAANDLEVKTVRSVSKTTLKAHAKETGECEGDGWELISGMEAFFATPAK